MLLISCALSEQCYSVVAGRSPCAHNLFHPWGECAYVPLGILQWFGVQQWLCAVWPGCFHREGEGWAPCCSACARVFVFSAVPDQSGSEVGFSLSLSFIDKEAQAILLAHITFSAGCVVLSLSLRSLKLYKQHKEQNWSMHWSNVESERLLPSSSRSNIKFLNMYLRGI